MRGQVSCGQAARLEWDRRKLSYQFFSQPANQINPSTFTGRMERVKRGKDIKSAELSLLGRKSPGQAMYPKGC